MTKRDLDKLAAAFARIANSGEVNQLTLRALAQSVEEEFYGDRATSENNLRGFRFKATGAIDLSRTDYIERIGAR